MMLALGGWEPPADLLQRTAVVLAGTCSVLLANQLLPLAFSSAGISAISSQLATFLTMTGVSFWLAGCVPLMARRAGLGQRKKD